MASSSSKRRTTAVSFLSGAVAGGAVKTLTAPLSRSTILLQTAGSEQLSGASLMKSSVSFLGEVRAVDGVVSFWKGNGASILQKMATTGSNYVVYEQVKNALRPMWRSEVDVGFGVRLASGSLAGALNVTLAYPFDLARTNIASSRGGSSETWASISSTLRALHARHGWGFLHRGLLCTQLCQGLNIGFHFGIYETLNTAYNRNTSESRAPRSTWYSSYACGSAAGFVASTVVQPLDLVRRRQQLVGSAAADRWFFCVVADIVRRNGPLALYRGILPELFKVCVVPTSGLNFLIYEFVRQDLFDERSGVR